MVTVADVLIPDALPFVDEIVLALLTVMFGMWKDRRGPRGPTKDIDIEKA